jgi:hypothetical protein
MKPITDDEIRKEMQGCSDEELSERIKGVESVVRDGFAIVGLYEGVHRDPRQVLQWLREENERRIRNKGNKGDDSIF